MPKSIGPRRVGMLPSRDTRFGLTGVDDNIDPVLVLKPDKTVRR